MDDVKFVMKLDADWVALVKEAEELGLTKEEVRHSIETMKQMNLKERA
nr:DNA-binding anti-repressor SinI [Halobacillus sp. A1]